MIIVEGCDGTGKTTLAQLLVKTDKRLTYVHESVPPESGYKYYLRRALELPQNVVVDRFHLGELVYPVIKKDRREPLTWWQQLHVELVLNARGAMLVLMTADEKFLKNVFKTRGETFITEADIFDVKKLFTVAYRRSLIRRKLSLEIVKVTADVTQQIIEAHIVLIKLVNVFKHHEFSGSPIVNCVMLVGDAYGDGGVVGTLRRRAFASPTGSSAYLARALAKLPRKILNQLYITNANKHLDVEQSKFELAEEVRKLHPAAVVALGRRASKVLEAINVKHRQVPHPQWWRRFKHHSLSAYSAMILDAIEVQL